MARHRRFSQFFVFCLLLAMLVTVYPIRNATKQLNYQEASAYGSSHVTDVSLGSNFSCAVTTSGGVKCWGLNDSRQVGNAGAGLYPSTPVDVTGLTSGVSSVASGNMHSCALTTSGGVKCWGSNSSGQLGNNSTTSSSTPVDVSGLSSGVSAVSSGSSHSCALTTSGGVKCWGNNGNGQLGDNSNTSSLVPVDVSGLSSGVTAISIGGQYSCALTSAGGVKCWGHAAYGQIGNGTFADQKTPADVSGLSSGVSAIATGTWHACAVMTDGTVRCWGHNEKKQIGNNSTTDSNIPVVVPSLSGVSGVAAGSYTSCVLKSGGVQCWGGNSNGQLGNKTTVDSATPVSVHTSSSDSTPLSGVSKIAAGHDHICALMASGVLKCWGYNGYSQLGRGSMTVNETTPDNVSVSGVSFGEDTTAPTFSAAAVNSAGTQVIVGFSEVLSASAPSAGDFSLGVNGASRTPTALTIAGSTVVLTTSPAITAGQTVTFSYTDPTAGNDANAIQDSSGNDASSIATSSVSNHVITSNLSLHESQTCAVTSLGGVKCWGSVGLTDRPLGDGTSASGSRTLVDVVTAPGQPLSNVVEVSVGNQFACALTSDGGVKCWGSNALRQLGDGTTVNRLSAVDVRNSDGTPLSGAVAIASSFYGACALMVNGGVKCWGENGFGQLGNGTTTDSATPVDVVTSSTDTSALRGVTAISGSATQTTCALMFSGGVKCWGVNDGGQLGAGTTDTYSTAPVDVLAASGSTTPMSGAVSVTSGGLHTCALISNGSVKCWGTNTYGQIGDGTVLTRSYPVTPTGLTSGVSAVTAGNHFTCALKTGGSVVCWGRNNYGQLGNGTRTNSATPVDVRTSSSVASQLTGVVKLSAGYYHTCAIMSSGGIKCWGYNGWSQLGDGTTTVGNSPVDVATGSASFLSDTSAPSFVSAATNTAGTTITLTYSEALSATTAASSAFAVTVAGVSRSVSGVAVSGSTVVLTLASAVTEGQSVTVAYTDPTGGNDASAVQDSAGNDAASLSATSVTNNSTVDVTAPSFVSAATNTAGTTVTLTYSEALSATTAASSAFAVTVGGASRSVSGVAVSGSTVVLTQIGRAHV